MKEKQEKKNEESLRITWKRYDHSIMLAADEDLLLISRPETISSIVALGVR